MSYETFFCIKTYSFKSRILIYLSFLLIGGVVLVFFHINSPIEFIFKKRDLLFEEKKINLNISQSVFCSKDNNIAPQLPDFSKMFQVTTYEPRPDEGTREKCLEVTLTNNEKKIIFSGEKIYLTYDGNYKFSNDITDFCLVFNINKSNKVNGSLKAKIGEKIIEESFELLSSEKELKDFKDEDAEALSLKQAICLGPDLFLDLTRAQSPILNRLIFPSKNVCYVKNGDLLIFKDKNWFISEGEDTKKFSLARINNISQTAIDLDYWKLGELFKRKIKIVRPSQGGAFHVGEDFITDINVRTKRQISCKIQGQRLVMTEKDMFYKKEGVWKKASHEDLITVKNATEFLIFEKLDLSSPEKKFLGYVFNSDKTQVVKIDKILTKKISGFSVKKPPSFPQNKKRR